MIKILNDFIKCIYRYGVSIVGVVALGIIFILSVICTCFKTADANEITFFCGDSIIKNVFFIMLFIVGLIIVSKIPVWDKAKTYLEDDAKFRRLKLVLLFAILCVSCFWVMITQYIPGSDQLDVVNCAYKLHAGEYNMFDPGGYLDKWTNQIGLAFIDYFLARIWGDFNIVAFQILNAVGLTVLYKKITDILDTAECSRLVQIALLVVGLLFFPLIMYTTFVYGTILHVAIALIAFDQEQKFFIDYKWWRVPICAFTMALSIQVKNNALIYLVGIVIYGLVNIFEDIKGIWKRLVLLAVTCVFVVGTMKCPAYVIEKHTGYKLDQGVSSYAFVAMGLQDGDFAPGWWNGYNNQSYEASGYNTEVQTKMAKEEIANRLEVLSNDKAYAFSFFTRKLASMWTDPTFQCFWLNQIRNHRVILPGWVESLMSAKGYVKAANFLDYFQPLIYLGAALWLIFENKEKFMKRSFFMMIFLGGFVFHSVWEAKTQYSVMYMALLLPCAVMGFSLLLEKINGVSIELTQRRIAHVAALSAVFVITLGSYSIAYKQISHGLLDSDTATFAEYIENWEPQKTNESVLEINIMKTEIKDHKDFIIYLERLLNDNQIGY